MSKKIPHHNFGSSCHATDDDKAFIDSMFDRLTPDKRWDEWYAMLPSDLKKRLSCHDFKRLGDLFADAFGVR